MTPPAGSARPIPAGAVLRSAVTSTAIEETSFMIGHHAKFGRGIGDGDAASSAKTRCCDFLPPSVAWLAYAQEPPSHHRDRSRPTIRTIARTRSDQPAR